jgi:hypothetical protein
MIGQFKPLSLLIAFIAFVRNYLGSHFRTGGMMMCISIMVMIEVYKDPYGVVSSTSILISKSKKLFINLQLQALHIINLNV